MSSKHCKCKTGNNSILVAIILLLLLNDNTTNSSADSTSGDISSSSNNSNFIENVYHNTTTNTINYSPPFNTASISMATVFVENIGSVCSVNAYLEISPDDDNYIIDSNAYDIKPGDLRAFVPSIYSKFIRIAFKSSINNCSTSIKIVFQGKA